MKDPKKDWNESEELKNEAEESEEQTDQEETVKTPLVYPEVISSDNIDMTKNDFFPTE